MKSDLAELILEDIEGERPLPVDIYGLIQSYGIDLQFCDELPANVGGLYIARRNPIIIINANSTPERRRFTAAHELFHHIDYMISPNKKAARFASFKQDGRVRDTKAEREANRFAANLLIPAGAFRRLSKTKTPAQLSKIFAVSIETINRRTAEVR